MMLMKKMALLALVAALVVSLVAGTAVAKKPDNVGKPPKPPKKEKPVIYVFQGTIAGVTQAGTDPMTGEPLTDPNTGLPVEDAVVVDVKQGNKVAKPYIGQQVEFAVGLETQIKRNDQEATLSDLQQGDKVMVQVKKKASADETFTASKVHAEGPEEVAPEEPAQ